MEAIIKALIEFSEFAATYELIKCIKTMMAGSVTALLLLWLHRTWKGKNSYLNICSMLLLFPMCLMGSSRLFYTGRLFFISNWLLEIIKPWMGKLYFAVAGGLLLRHIFKNARLRRKIKRLPVLADTELKKQLIEKITRENRLPFFFWYLRRVEIYETKEAVSPFSGGFINPYVVVPVSMTEGFDRKELSLVLCHELLHIKSGHLWLLEAVLLLKIYWWVNPLIYLCEKALREELELACDESCLYYMRVPEEAYGNVILNTLYLMQGISAEGSLTFLKYNTFEELKWRLSHLWDVGKKRHCYGKKVRQGVFISGTLALVTAALVINFSYPRYTKLEEISLYDSQLTMVIFDSEKMNQAVQPKEGKITIEEELFQEILEEENVTGERVFVSYDTIMKVPGVGGGGNVAMISTKDFSDIMYLSAEGMADKVMMFLLKYVL